MTNYQKYKQAYNNLMKIHGYFESWIFKPTKTNLKALMKAIEETYHAAPSDNQ